MPKDSDRQYDIEKPLEATAMVDAADNDTKKTADTARNELDTSFSSYSRGRISIQSNGDSKATKATNSRSVVVPLDPSILELVSKMGESLELDEDDDEHHRCCRNYHHVCCCVVDVRRASIIANIVYAMAGIVFMIMVLAPEAMGMPSGYDDDQFQERINTLSQGTVPRNSIGLIMAVVGSVGAYRFQKWPVLAMVVWYGIYLVWAILGDRYFSGVFAGILLYPTITLFLALHHGKLTPKNYATESRCCSLMHNSQTNCDD